jgi:peptidoglycan hydrolase-like amidase
MKKALICLLGLLLVIGLFWSGRVRIRAISPIDELQQQIDALTKAREQSIAATTPLEAELARLRQQLSDIEAGLQKAKNELAQLQASITKREADFATQYVLLAERVASIYKASKMPSSFLVLLSSGVGSSQIKDFFYRQVLADRDKSLIAQISEDLIQLEKDKKQAEEDKLRLADLQAKVDKEAKFFAGEIAGAKAYQEKLSQQIAQLTALQQQIIAEKLGSLNLPQSLGAGPLVCVDDRKINPGFSPAFAFFTYGIPHRVGMNQYGAYGRAKDGQSSDQILRAYYNFDGYQDGVNSTIKVNDGNGIDQGSVIWSGSLDDYVKRIYEMPGDWPSGALKAQAIAVRSYVLAVTDNGNKSICANQHCQVFKTDPKGGAWDQAVSDTKGKVMVLGGQIITAWYSSTDGGYTFTSGDVWGSDKAWTKRTRDTEGDVGGFGDLQAKAYDRDSPCFYAAQGWRSEYAKSAWLKPAEVADIANVILLVRNDPSAACFVYQTDKAPPAPNAAKGCSQTGNWSAEEVKQKLGSQALSTASSVEISGVDWGSGRTTQIKINGIPFNGDEFKNYFNVRAPANIQIVGPLYNVERR